MMRLMRLPRLLVLVLVLMLMLGGQRLVLLRLGMLLVGLARLTEVTHRAHRASLTGPALTRMARRRRRHRRGDRRTRRRGVPAGLQRRDRPAGGRRVTVGQRGGRRG